MLKDSKNQASAVVSRAFQRMRPLGLTIRLGDGRDALPRDPRQDVRWLSPGATPLIVYALRRVRRSTSTDAFQSRDAGRARVHLPSEVGTPDMTIGRAEADRAGARPYLRRRPSGSVPLFLALHTQKQSLPVSPFFERFLYTSDTDPKPANLA